MHRERATDDGEAPEGARQPKACPHCQAQYDTGLRFCPSDGAALVRRDAGEDPTGQVIGDRYLILREIDSGGMGRVYLAQHLRMGRRCAVKIMRRALLEDESARARFNREAESASRISHPNVATIYDFGDTSDGTAYLAMEYVPGESLAKLLEREGPLAPTRAATIVAQIASGLEAAHELPIVHRDLKPDNVMVCGHRDGSEAVKLVDFGIAKAVVGDGSTVTALGLVVGTPDYMAPEQAAGKAVDARADVYALGLVAFHLLTGELAFAGETPSARMLMRLSDPPRTLTQARADVPWPSEVQSVLDRALARDPAARYQSAAALGQDLAAAIADWQRDPRRRPWRRTGAALRRIVVVIPARVLRGGRARAVLAGATVAGLLAAGVGLAWKPSAPAAPDRALARATLAHPLPARAPTPDTSGGDVEVPADDRPAALAPDASLHAGPATGRRADRADRSGADGAPRERARPRAVPAPPVASTAAASTPARLREVESATAALRSLVGPARARAARDALAEIDRLLPALRTARDSVAALYAAVEVHLGVGDDAAACTILRQIREPARRTEFADGVDALLSAPVPVCRSYGPGVAPAG